MDFSLRYNIPYEDQILSNLKRFRYPNQMEPNSEVLAQLDALRVFGEDVLKYKLN